MKKTQSFPDMHLSLAGMRKLDEFLIRPGGIFDEPHCSNFALIEPNRAEWNFDNSETFLADYHPSFGSYYERTRSHYGVTVVNHLDSRSCNVTVTAPDKKAIQSIFAIIEKHRQQSTVHAAPGGWKVYCRKPVTRHANHEDQQPVA